MVQSAQHRLRAHERCRRQMVAGFRRWNMGGSTWGVGHTGTQCTVRAPTVVLGDALSEDRAQLRLGQRKLGFVEAGLAQFNSNAKLENCVPDGQALDLSDRFVNFLIADNRPWKGGQFGEHQARAVASLLADDFYQLADSDGTKIPLIDGARISAIGSTAYRFAIVLVAGPQPSVIDAVISRETARTKFAPRLSEADRRSSRLKWSNIE
jgi:hypothetical protein